MISFFLKVNLCFERTNIPFLDSWSKSFRVSLPPIWEIRSNAFTSVCYR